MCEVSGNLEVFTKCKEKFADYLHFRGQIMPHTCLQIHRFTHHIFILALIRHHMQPFVAFLSEMKYSNVCPSEGTSSDNMCLLEGKNQNSRYTSLLQVVLWFMPLGGRFTHCFPVRIFVEIVPTVFIIIFSQLCSLLGEKCCSKPNIFSQ